MASRAAPVSQPESTIESSTMFHRASAFLGLTAGSQLLGDGMMPARSAACSTVSADASTPK